MSGIYLHIPFCKSKCSYCNFCSIATLKHKTDFLKALENELQYSSKNIAEIEFSSIYFGGGTPSILNYNEIQNIFEVLYKHYKFTKNCEINFEANPEDLSSEYLKNLINTPINRLSIGLQSMDDEILKLLRRRHNAERSINSVIEAYNIGFENISVDVIYGINGLSSENFENHLKIICKLPINHISAYHLEIEKGTLLYKMLNENKISVIDETLSFKHYNTLIDTLQSFDFEQYEISNFAKNKKVSHHNSSYWDRSIYYGFGPSAHSFDGKQRFYNTTNIQDYISEGLKNNFFVEYDKLNESDIINEYLMLNLRTSKGINLEDYQHCFGNSELSRLKTKVSKLNQDWFNLAENFLSFTREGMFVSNHILINLFVE
ncbi:MAG TPA: radical SAM family heme chaperone HemW [Bacteroidales bacterium]|nr:radical SAM family heme chaperone HemW [Bacteroidales bacterium]